MTGPGKHPLLLVALAFALLGSGCRTATLYGHGRRSSPYGKNHEVKPVVAVTDFENLSNFAGQWNLGEGMADLLVVELLSTKRVTVLEREHLDDVVGEIFRQGRDLFRREGRVERGRLKNAKFLFRGSITDFTIVGEGSGRFRSGGFRLFGGGSRTRVALSVNVSDVETGEIVSSVKADSTVSSGGFGSDASYRKVAFGGDTFFRTPLGRATEAAIRKAVRQILKDLPSDYWEPRVAEAGPDLVIINGGENVGLQEGDRFLVRAAGRPVTDPITGDLLEILPGPILGTVQVRAVHPTSAHAILLDGTAERGSILERISGVKEQPPRSYDGF